MDLQTYQTALSIIDRLDYLVDKAINQLKQIELEEGIGFAKTSDGYGLG